MAVQSFTEHLTVLPNYRLVLGEHVVGEQRGQRPSVHRLVCGEVGQVLAHCK